MCTHSSYAEERMIIFIIASLLLNVVITRSAGSPPVTLPPLTVSGNVSSCPLDTTAARETLTSMVKGVLTGMLAPSSVLVSECGEGLWYKIAHLNMSDPNEHCPSVWKEYTTPIRTCGRQVSSVSSCSSNNYSSNGRDYSKVCGRVLGYGYGYTNAFDGLSASPSPDANYVEGVSITHGAPQPRTHIWTYAAGNSENSHYLGSCPCIGGGNGRLPPAFVGDNYHCESGNRVHLGPGLVFITDDVLWDGIRCEGNCCNRSPPWFSVMLPVPTSDDIEVRICGQGGTNTEDTPIKLIEIFVQ